VFALDRGAGVRLFERFDAGLLARELSEASRAVVYLVPTMLSDLDDPGARPFDGVHSVVVSGAKMEAHHWEIARRLFPHALVGELYGASELSFVSVNTEGEDPADPGYVGRPFPGVEIEIRPTEEASADGAGVVHVRSPYLFEGYLDGSETSSPVGPDGFMTVGDIGRLTERGLSLVGRASNMLITGGKNVHPEEVEAQLGRHPGVDECVVLGLPHPRWGEELVAFLTAADDADGLSAEPLRAYLKERVASYKVPKRWFLVDEIPRTRAQKTDRSPERLFDGATEIV
jgi:long-chain acyl-CoA synthetase